MARLSVAIVFNTGILSTSGKSLFLFEILRLPTDWVVPFPPLNLFAGLLCLYLDEIAFLVFEAMFNAS